MKLIQKCLAGNFQNKNSFDVSKLEAIVLRNTLCLKDKQFASQKKFYFCLKSWNSLCQCFSTAGTRPGTGTWNIRETKNLFEITMKSSIFKDKVIRNIYYRDN